MFPDKPPFWQAIARNLAGCPLDTPEDRQAEEIARVRREETAAEKPVEWRMLEVGETIHKGDQFLYDGSEWLASRCPGSVVLSGQTYRRRVGAAATAPAVAAYPQPDPVEDVTRPRRWHELREDVVTLAIVQRSDSFKPLEQWDWSVVLSGLDFKGGESVRVMPTPITMWDAAKKRVEDLEEELKDAREHSRVYYDRLHRADVVAQVTHEKLGLPPVVFPFGVTGATADQVAALLVAEVERARKALHEEIRTSMALRVELERVRKERDTVHAAAMAAGTQVPPDVADQDGDRVEIDMHGLAKLLQNERDEARKQRDAALRRVVELSKMHGEHRRWNFERTHDGIRVCFGNHDRAAACEWEDFVPADKEAPGLRSLVENLRDKLRSCESALKESESERTEAIRDFRGAVKAADRHRAERDAVLRERYAINAKLTDLERERDEFRECANGRAECLAKVMREREEAERERNKLKARVAELERGCDVPYDPKYDEAALDRFAEEGAKAWATAPAENAGGWLTADDREILTEVADEAEKSSSKEKWAHVASGVRAILAREKPPVVTLLDIPAEMRRQACSDYLIGWDRCRSADVQALKAAGVEVTNG